MAEAALGSTRIITLEFAKEDRAFVEGLLKSTLPEVVVVGIARLFQRMAPRAARSIVRTELSSPYSFRGPGSTLEKIRRRSGTLARSVEGIAQMRDGIPSLRVGVFRGPALRYAGIQRFGTKGKNPASPYDTIRPRNARFLAVPMKPVLQFNGVEKYPGGPRSYPKKLVFIPFRSGGKVAGALYDAQELLEARRRAGGEVSLRDVQALYLLMRSVDLRPWFYLEIGLRKWMPELVRAVATLLRRTMNPNG
jgi:hypothetical protein